MRGRLEPKDTVERFWGLKFIGFPNLSDETPKPKALAFTSIPSTQWSRHVRPVRRAAAAGYVPMTNLRRNYTSYYTSLILAAL